MIADWFPAFNLHADVILIVGAEANASVEQRILADHPGIQVTVIDGGQRATTYQVGVA